MNNTEKTTIDSILGKMVLIKKGHPHEGETGIIQEFNPSIGITGKPGFLIKGDNGQTFFIFSANKIKYI